MTTQCVEDSRQHDQSEQELEELLLQGRMGDIGRKLLVLSGKGGVGKSTVAANLAVALAASGKKVGLLDVDVHGPSIPKLLGLEGRGVTNDGAMMVPVEMMPNLSVMSIGFLLRDGAEPVIWRGPRKYGVIRQFLKDVAWGRLDYLVVDSPPGTGDEPLAVAQLVGTPASAVIVTTPQDVAISDVRRCVSFCGTLSLPVQGIVENMSGLVCPKCQERIDLFKAGGGRTLADEMQVPFLGDVPIDPEIVLSGDAGMPFAGASASTASATAFAEIVDRILADDKGNADGQADQEAPREGGTLRIAVPLARGKLSAHFGHCETFALVDVEENAVVGVASHKPPAHEPGLLPRWLHEKGAKVIIAGGMGQRAQQLFGEQGIETILGAPAETAEALVSAYLAGTLRAGDNVCDH
ncbi:MAG: P-loop NTPase [bacterium]|nr:P-loop NTPase [bacterium]